MQELLLVQHPHRLRGHRAEVGHERGDAQHVEDEEREELVGEGGGGHRPRGQGDGGGQRGARGRGGAADAAAREAAQQEAPEDLVEAGLESTVKMRSHMSY